MAYRKTAISVSEELLDEVDRAAQDRGESRSRFVCRVLELAVRARRDAEVTKRLDDLFADDSLREDQRSDVEKLEDLAVDWTNERW